MRFCKARQGLAAVLLLAGVCVPTHAAEHVTLRNGFELDCVRREAAGDRVRLYFAGTAPEDSSATNFMEVPADSVVRVEEVVDVPQAVVVKAGASRSAAVPAIARGFSGPTKAEMLEMLTNAGAAHNIDADLLASVVRAESGGQVHAVSRTGAQGLMQLMPGTAKTLGVKDSFQPEQNIAGGTAYLDGLLVRYHDNIALALAAYNAGPGAVDRYHGVPPYAETRAYVARVIREFNRRKQTALVAQAR
jgi:hypothetical protein